MYHPWCCVYSVYKMGSANLEKKWLIPLVVSSLLFVFLHATSFNMGLVSSLRSIGDIFSLFQSHMAMNGNATSYAISKVSPSGSGSSPPELHRFAYLVSGSKGDLDKLCKTLWARYHPRNQYVAHLDLESPAKERLELASRVENDPLFSKVRNVHVITKSNMVTYRGPTMVANTLHACAILLKKSKEWDWFINLHARISTWGMFWAHGLADEGLKTCPSKLRSKAERILGYQGVVIGTVEEIEKAYQESDRELHPQRLVVRETQMLRGREHAGA